MPEISEPNYQEHLDQRRAELKALFLPQLKERRTLTLEIGAGHGHFLTAYATQHPERFCVGIDIMSDRINRGLRKRDRARLENLTFVHSSAEDLLAVLPEGVSLDGIFILFPDPWPKRRHWKNRLMQPEFLRALATRTQPEAPLYFRTDYAPYFEYAREVVAAHPNWKIGSNALWPFEHQTVFQSRAPTYQSLVAHCVP